ncbi:hypothetical protein [Embleya sp. NPDC001921]
MRWDLGTYTDVKQVPVMVHPSNRANEKAILVEGMRVITPQKLDALKKAMTASAVALSDGIGRWGPEHAVQEQLTHHKLTAPNLFNTYAQSARP